MLGRVVLRAASRQRPLLSRALSTTIDQDDEAALREVMKTMPDKVKIAATDIDGVLRSKYISSEKFVSGLNSAVGFCSVIFGWDINDKCYDNTKLVGGHTGYADVYAKLDPKTIRLLPWENNVPFILMDFVDGELKPFPICPRQLLKSVIRNGAADTKLSPLAGLEYEYYTFKETSHSLHEKSFTSPTPLTPGMFGYSALRTGQNSVLFDDIFSQMKAAGITLETLHTETGPGVFEAALEYGHPLTIADNASLFRYGMKVIGHKHGVFPCFMAKPHANLPGCSGHIHLSLTNADGVNVFFDPGDDYFMSQTFKHFVAGQMLLMPELMAMYCPTVNSYKRLTPGFWAPTSPSWGIENRITSLRVIPDGKKGTRLEVRIPGADSNPYLALSAALASGFYGIANKISLDSFPMTIGSSLAQSPSVGRFPRNLLEAAEKLHASSLARELLGDAFVDHFAATREWEWRQFQSAVTNWELERYMEIV